MDAEEYELLKRRLIDEVSEKAQTQILRRYSALAAGAAVVVSLLGWNFAEDLKTRTNSSVEKAVSREIAASKTELDGLDREVQQQVGRIGSYSEQVEQVRNVVNDQIVMLQKETKDLVNLTEDVSSLLQARRDLETRISEITVKTDNLQVLAEDLKRVAETVQTLEAIGPAVNAELRDVIGNVESAESYVQAKLAQPTVYLQFAGGSRTLAEELSKKLGADGFSMPGEQRHSGAAGKREIRYFHESDKATAERLQAATLNALSDMKASSSPNVIISDYTEYKGVAPNQGTLELWIEL